MQAIDARRVGAEDVFDVAANLPLPTATAIV
jgi:hypothetical protein